MSWFTCPRLSRQSMVGVILLISFRMSVRLGLIIKQKQRILRILKVTLDGVYLAKKIRRRAKRLRRLTKPLRRSLRGPKNQLSPYYLNGSSKNQSYRAFSSLRMATKMIGIQNQPKIMTGKICQHQTYVSPTLRRQLSFHHRSRLTVLAGSSPPKRHKFHPAKRLTSPSFQAYHCLVMVAVEPTPGLHPPRNTNVRTAVLTSSSMIISRVTCSLT